jgi:hypothetical protein
LAAEGWKPVGVEGLNPATFSVPEGFALEAAPAGWLTPKGDEAAFGESVVGALGNNALFVGLLRMLPKRFDVCDVSFATGVAVGVEPNEVDFCTVFAAGGSALGV